jgi:hypothetical protein
MDYPSNGISPESLQSHSIFLIKMDIEYHLNILNTQRCEYLTQSRIQLHYIHSLQKCIGKLTSLPTEIFKNLTDELGDIYRKYNLEIMEYYTQFYKRSSTTTSMTTPSVKEDMIYECYEKMSDIFLQEGYKEYFE